ncbi:type II secretion system protein [Patescibacteria group bacterium]|nr:type II secretion system protein [Patescibacteria group bacterium]
MKQKGFTLIELLIVIAIIGLLASIVLISLGPARAKARDARRVTDVRQMSTALEVEASDNPEALTGCVLADAKVNTCTGCSGCPSNNSIVGFVNFADPSVGTGGTACANGTSATCQYSISQADGSLGATTGDYQICFWLESGAGSLAEGLHSIETNGVFTNDCTL